MAKAKAKQASPATTDVDETKGKDAKVGAVKPKTARPKKAAAKPKAAPAGRDVAPAKTEDSTRPDNALERGDLFFFYRPDVDDDAPGGLLDVRRFHLALRPSGGDAIRLITVGRKTLPDSGAAGGSHWAFVDRIFDAPEALKEYLDATTYETETSGERNLPEARPAGEGVYAIARHERDSVLAYVLELPEQIGEVQEAFGIQTEGRFILSIKNPDGDSPAGLGLDTDRKAELPAELKSLFGARKWHPADPTSFLDHEGVELILIGGRIAPDDDLGIELSPEPEDEASSEVFRDLHLNKSERTTRPLFDGRWA